MVNRLFDCMRDYFSLSGWRLERDDNYGVISLLNEYGHNRLRMDRFTTLFLYTCRLIYEEGREQGDHLHIVRTDTGAIVEKMRMLGLLEKGKTTQKERLEAQRALAHFNIIQKTESTAWNADGNGVLIFPSVLSIISNQGVNDMMIELEDLRTEDTNVSIVPEAQEQEDFE
jgi:DNA-binding MarR family transcriptional regulator